MENDSQGSRGDWLLKLTLVSLEKPVVYFRPESIHAMRRGMLVCTEDHERTFFNWRIVNSFTMGSALWPRFIDD